MDEFPFCPKCTGCIDHDDAYVESLNLWIRYLKCLNCGWRLEQGTYRRFTNVERTRHLRNSKKLSGRDHRRQANTVARYGKFSW